MELKNQAYIVTITKCPRCSKEHKNLAFKKLTSAILDYQYWCLCPELSEPILGINYREEDMLDSQK